MNELTAARLRDLLAYDPDTGVFTRKVRTAHRCKVGDVAGSLNAEGYRYIRLLGRHYKANRIAWLYVHGAWPTGVVDHINGDRGDDRIVNLRVCTNAENSQNRRRPAGAYPCQKGGGFFSTVMVDGIKHYLGRFATRDEARAAYVEAKHRLHPFQNTGNLNA